jgi:trans-aconitate 2-methyltransferase
MLEKSAAFTGGGLRFEKRDLRTFTAEGTWDLVFSNAALQWVPEHAALFGNLYRALAAQGQLAVQMPANQGHPSHVTAAEVAAESPFSESMLGPKPQGGMLAVEDYASLLHRLGFRQQHVRLQVYGHALAQRDEVIEWVKGTLLTDYQRRLPAELYPKFLERYRERLLPKLEDRRPYFYPFKRILLWARK